MHLWESELVSGGFIAGHEDRRRLSDDRTQQQFFTRNTAYSAWQDGAFNHYALVFVGNTAAPTMKNWPTVSYSVVGKTPVIAEKPFLYIDKGETTSFAFLPPKPTARGPSCWRRPSAGRSITTGRFYVANPGVDSSTTLNAALLQGKHLLFTPGVYTSQRASTSRRADTVVMASGLATLIPDQGTPIFRVADVDGVRFASLLLASRPGESDSLLELGPRAAAPTNAQIQRSCPMSRVASAEGAGKATACFVINSTRRHRRQLVGMARRSRQWRRMDANPSKNGVVVNGNDVTIYGLFVEHPGLPDALERQRRSPLFLPVRAPLRSPEPGRVAVAAPSRDIPRTRSPTSVTNPPRSRPRRLLGVLEPSQLRQRDEAPAASGVQMHHMRPRPSPERQHPDRKHLQRHRRLRRTGHTAFVFSELNRPIRESSATFGPSDLVIAKSSRDVSIRFARATSGARATGDAIDRSERGARGGLSIHRTTRPRSRDRTNRCPTSGRAKPSLRRFFKT